MNYSTVAQLNIMSSRTKALWSNVGEYKTWYGAKETNWNKVQNQTKPNDALLTETHENGKIYTENTGMI